MSKIIRKKYIKSGKREDRIDELTESEANVGTGEVVAAAHCDIH